MSIATRFVGKNWYGHFVTTLGTCVLNGDFREFTWTRDGELVDATAGGDAYTSEKWVRETNTFSLSLLATTDGTAYWQNYFAPGTEGTLVFSGGDGTANGRPKYSCPVIVHPGSEMTIPYDGVVELSVEWGGQGTVTFGTWSNGA